MTTLSGLRVPLPDEPLAHLAFEAHAQCAPHRLALTCGTERRTYGELNARANQFAHHLHSLTVGRGSVVGVCLDRSPELVVSILGILKAGAAYVPLDPTYPPERLKLMISELTEMTFVAISQATVDLVGRADDEILDVAALASRLDTFPTTNPSVGISGDDLCYVVFTSGSTGAPKATAVRHESWYNLLNWLMVEYRLDMASSNLMVSSFGFDISQRSLMTPLFTGAPLHLLPSRSFDIGMTYRLIGELGVRTLHCAPSTFYLLVERETAKGTDALTKVHYMFIGGEPLSPGRVAEWATQEGNTCVLLHQYGVAECTDVASSHVMTDYPAYIKGVVPVGRPVYNTAIHLLDEELRKVADGQTGEICISGISVGGGYLNAVAADAKRFVAIDLYGQQVSLYRTGDRGYVTEASELVVVGRTDAQVKIRGMRIDLGDVEHRVRDNVRVRDVAVLAVPADDGESELVAFVIPAGEPIDERKLRGELLDVLPQNMVPREFVELPAFPLNPNGKVDRQSLAKCPTDKGVISDDRNPAARTGHPDRLHRGGPRGRQG